MRRPFVSAVLLALLVAVTLPPLIVLCRGRSPSRFSAVNLPSWERKAPHEAHAQGVLLAVPLPPGAVQWDPALVQGLARADENRLLAGMEAPGRHPTLAAGDGGAWLENACALGRRDPALAAKQDRVALRLMTAEDADGYLAAGQGRGRWTASQVQAASRNLRGLIACFALTHHVAVVYAAMQAADLVVSTPALGAAPPAPHAAMRAAVPTASLVLPIARLYLLTRQERYKQWAVHQARAGRADVAGLCAVYLVTGRAGFLRQAQQAWKQSADRGKTDPDAAACLLAVTNAPGFARVVRSRPAPWPCPLASGSLALTQTPQGVSVNAWADARWAWHGGMWTLRTTKKPGGAAQITVTIAAKQPVQAALSFPMAGAYVDALVNGAFVSFAPRQAVVTLSRVWRTGDQVSLTAVPIPIVARPVTRPVGAVPPQPRQ